MFVGLNAKRRAAALAALLLSACQSPPPSLASITAVPPSTSWIKEGQYALTNRLWNRGCPNGCPMTYDPDLVEVVGSAFSINYTDPGGTSGMDAYVSGDVGGKKIGGTWRPGNKTLTGMPIQIQDLEYDLRIRWSVSQEEAWDDDDKWWATINVIMDPGTGSEPELSQPDPDQRLFDIVIQLDRYEQDALEDVSKDDKRTYWWFARDPDGSIKPFVLNIDGKDYEWGVRYKFFRDQGVKDDKVHIKFIPVNNSDVAPYIDHPLKVFTEACRDYMQYVDLPDLEMGRADERVSEPTLWVKAISAGYETYTGSSILRQDELRVVLDETPPPAPGVPSAAHVHAGGGIGGGDVIALDWPDVGGDEPSLRGYSLYRSDDGGTTYSNIASDLTGTSFVDSDVAAETNGYKYYVTASDRSYNESPPSPVVDVPPSWTTVQVPVSEDAYAVQNDPDRTTGSFNHLQVRKDGDESAYTRVAYLKFDVSGLSLDVGNNGDGGGREVKSAVLRVYSDTETDAVNALSVSDNSWTEAGLTWAARPATGQVIGTGQAPAAGSGWFGIDITGYVAGGNGVYSLALDERGNTAGKLGSREGNLGARLEITTGPAAPPTPSPTSAPTTASPTSSPTSLVNSIAFDAIEDAYAKQSQPDGNFASSGSLEVRMDTAANAFSRVPYLKFRVEGISRYVKRATLQVYSVDELDSVDALAVADNSWTESDLTWNGPRPETGDAIGTGQASAPGTWFDIDVTGYVASGGNGVYSVALDERGNSLGRLGSREGGYAARLLVETGPSDPPTWSPTDSPTASPTDAPTTAPTLSPTDAPTASPTRAPTPIPTLSPTPLYHTTGYWATEDAFVKQNAPTENTGTWKKLQLRQEYGGSSSSYSRLAYLKFELTGVEREVSSAALHLFSITETDQIEALSVADNSWTEGGLTWDSRPETGGTIGTGQASSAGSWFAIDITGYVTGNGSYTIALDERGDSVGELGSRESGYGAYVEIVTGPPPSSGTAGERGLIRGGGGA